MFLQQLCQGCAALQRPHSGATGGCLFLWPMPRLLTFVGNLAMIPKEPIREKPSSDGSSGLLEEPCQQGLCGKRERRKRALFWSEGSCISE